MKPASNLQHGGLDASHRQDVVNLPAVEVGQANGSDQAFFHQLLHGRPGQLVVDVVIQQRAVLLPGEGNVPLSAQGRKWTLHFFFFK